ncbi:HAD family hydrolase [Paenibacillus silvisoli]|uniref:HAD family hydrolase n=1 Tax=Paenibacillus silvisoli TaxID=3110539 RepID=UPI002804F2E2|nr:HAD hydrolase family protein [Paenibacillus silvisoli]
MGASISASFSDPDGIDIMPGGADKGAGVRLLMACLGIAQHEVACFGDSFNDLAMFDVSPNSFAMSHANWVLLIERSIEKEVL